MRVWDADTAREVVTITGESALAVALSPDGAAVVSGGDGPDVVVREVATGRVRHRLAGAGAPIRRLEFSPDGARLVVVRSTGPGPQGEGGGGLTVWDAATGALQFALGDHPAGVTDATFSPDGRRLVSADRTGQGPGLGGRDRPPSADPARTRQPDHPGGLQPRRPPPVRRRRAGRPARPPRRGDGRADRLGRATARGLTTAWPKGRGPAANDRVVRTPFAARRSALKGPIAAPGSSTARPGPAPGQGRVDPGSAGGGDCDCGACEGAGSSGST